MDSRGVIGKRITGIVQSSVNTHCGRRVTVDYIELENGVRLIPSVHETEMEPIGDLIVNRTKQRK